MFEAQLELTGDKIIANDNLPVSQVFPVNSSGHAQVKPTELIPSSLHVPPFSQRTAVSQTSSKNINGVNSFFTLFFAFFLPIFHAIDVNACGHSHAKQPPHMFYIRFGRRQALITSCSKFDILPIYRIVSYQKPISDQD